MKQFFKKFIAFLCVGILLASLSWVAADEELLGTLNFNAEFEGKKISGLEKSIYYCASMADNGFCFVDAFRDYPARKTMSSVEEWNELAVGFDGYVSANALEPTATRSSDENGRITFDNLEQGLYFVSGSVYNDHGTVYTSAPFFVCLTEEEPTVEASLKLSCEPAPGYVVRKVIKFWNDDGDEASRPKSITVILYADGVEYDRVELTKEMNWRYWWVLPEEHNWTLYELTPEGYTCKIEFKGLTFLVENTPEHETPPPPTPPDLPQTGLVWWPIPVFFACGLSAVAVALKLRRVKLDEKK